MEYKSFPHIIHRQVLDLSLPADIFPNEAQERFKNSFYAALPGIENVFSLYDDPEQLILVDKIFIDLGRIDYEKLDELFSLRVCEALSNALHDSVGTLTRGMHKTRKSSTDKNKDAVSINSILSHHSPATVDTGEVSTHTLNEGICKAFLYFLINGIFPWWLDKREEEEIETVFAPVTAGPPAEFIKQLRDLLIRDKNALSRLLYQFSEDFLRRILIGLLSQATVHVNNLYEFFNEFSGIDKRNTTRDEKQNHFAQVRTSFEIAISGSDHVALTIIVDHIQDGIRKNHFTREEILKLPGLKSLVAGNKEIKQKLYTVVSGIPGQSPGKSGQDIVKPPNHFLNRPDSDNPIVTDERKATPDETIDEHVYVDHAGLVLIHPFLQVLFSTLGLINEEHGFVDTISQVKAVHLLAFLACGKKECTETELPFCKFLCGMPLKKAIAKTVQLADNEIAECDQLLNAVIKHWHVLKNTSHDGLREGFLSRKGKLDLHDEIPVLYVEAKAQDVLLEKLPWGINYVQLPWIDKPFTTMWN